MSLWGGNSTILGHLFTRSSTLLPILIRLLMLVGLWRISSLGRGFGVFLAYLAAVGLRLPSHIACVCLANTRGGLRLFCVVRFPGLILLVGIFAQFLLHPIWPLRIYLEFILTN